MFSPDDPRTVTRQVLVDILQQEGPLLGAKLKVLLFADLSRRLNVGMSELEKMIPKLGPFLAENVDLVQVARGQSDITVSLASPDLTVNTVDAASSNVWFLAEVWQAFLNPDPQRRRFFHRSTHKIVHFLSNSTARPNPEIACRVQADPAFIEIDFAPAAVQTDWMREFLETNAFLSEWSKRVCRHFLSVPFESAVNEAFSAALKQHSSAWKRLRSTKADQLIKEWADKNRVSVADLQKPSERTPNTESDARVHLGPSGMIANLKPAESTQANELKLALHRVVDLLDPQDLDRISVPISVLVRVMHENKDDR